MKKGRFSAHLHFFQMDYIIWMQDRWREGRWFDGFLNWTLLPYSCSTDWLLMSWCMMGWRAAPLFVDRLPDSHQPLHVLMWSAGSGGIMENCVWLVSHDSVWVGWITCAIKRCVCVLSLDIQHIMLAHLINTDTCLALKGLKSGQNWLELSGILNY